MPYYLFKISRSDDLGLVKQLDLIDSFDAFRDAKKTAKKLRAQGVEEGSGYKVMFAENQLSAEEQLLEKREAPILMEHER
ncbi:MAG: hypothetical protein PVI79_12985 [Gammaproteobacteria bacterium]|jgi:hypothetical protein